MAEQETKKSFPVIAGAAAGMFLGFIIVVMAVGAADGRIRPWDATLYEIVAAGLFGVLGGVIGFAFR